MVTLLVAIAVVLASQTPSPAPSRHVVVTSTVCGVLPQIVFARGSAQLPPGSDKTLAAIASTLDGNPSLQLVAVEANASAAEARDLHARQSLRTRRANAVRARLIAMGVAPVRLIARAGTGHDPDIDFIVLARADSP
jgi:outer membrane protein OmpA-like peptidoglycan-associated protein